MHFLCTRAFVIFYFKGDKNNVICSYVEFPFSERRVSNVFKTLSNFKRLFMIFTQGQIQDILSILKRYELIFIADQLGVDFLSQSDKDILIASGINLDKYTNKKGIVEHAFLWGILAEAIGDARAKKMTYDQFQKFLASGNFIPLTEEEEFALQQVKNRAYTDITSLGSRMRTASSNIIIRGNTRQQVIVQNIIKQKTIKAVELRYGARTLASDFGNATKDWERDWLRIAYYLLHEAYNVGRSQSILKNHGADAEVYFDVYPGACERCRELYLTDPDDVNSEPIIFKLKDLIANGNNIGRKAADWLPTIAPTHPYCRCTINYKKPGYDWNPELRAFTIPKKIKPKNPKLQGVKLNIRISKAVEDELNKAVAAIGEIRQWGDGMYKKIADGKWSKVTNGKEKVVAGSGMIKKLQEEFQNKNESLSKIKREFEDSLESKFPRGTVAYNVFFQKAWQDEQDRNEFIKKLKEEQSDLNKEVYEIKRLLDKEAKLKREAKAGKKEMDVPEVQEALKDMKSIFYKVEKEVPRSGTGKQIMPDVTIDDYFYDTETVFRSVLRKDEKWNEVEERWKKMIDSKKYDWHRSPKSSSEYLIDKETGDIYRYADHWGKVASCDWNLISKNEGGYNIAKSNIKNFVRKDSGVYFNPQYRIKIVEAANIVLPRLKNLVSDNKDFYLTEKARKEVAIIAGNFFNTLKHSADLSMEEIDRLKKEYYAI